MPPTSARRSSPARLAPVTPAPRRWGAWRVGLPVAALLLLLVTGAPRVHADPPDPRETCYQNFERAFETGNAAGVVGCMDPRGRVQISLNAGRTASGVGGWTADQAKRALAEYFRLHVRGMKLVLKRVANVPISHVQRFDYDYRLAGGDTQQTSLTVTLRKSGELWVLASVRETARPRQASGAHGAAGG